MISDIRITKADTSFHMDVKLHNLCLLMYSMLRVFIDMNWDC